MQKTRAGHLLRSPKHVPLDVIGMDAKKLGGLGEILHPQLGDFIKSYLFFFNPIRYTSLGLAVIEAMMTGLPVVGLVTTDMVTVIRDGVSGFLHTDVNYLITRMKALPDDRTLASRVGAEGKKLAVQRRNLKRFTAEWYDLIQEVIRRKTVMTVA